MLGVGLIFVSCPFAIKAIAPIRKFKPFQAIHRKPVSTPSAFSLL